MYDIIVKKSKGFALTKDEINYVITNYNKGLITNEQMSSLLMAIVINGMNTDETYNLTKAMQNSGETLKTQYKLVDKHSTGGVSDSTTLIIIPILASLGLKSVKMSGGALGYTGGTADKVKVFDGYNLTLNKSQIEESLDKIGAVIISQNSKLAPVDKKIYELRSATGTVQSIPLIASSIMSKKLACGADTILLDVKFGNGALMTKKSDSIKLAKLMTAIGKKDGKNVIAVISEMNKPLSNGIGNSCEIFTVLEALNNKPSDLLKLSKELASLIYTSATGIKISKARELVNESIVSGKAKAKLRDIIKNQKGNTSCFDNQDLLLSNTYKTKIKSKIDGIICNIDALQLAKIESGLEKNLKGKEFLHTGILFKKWLGDKVTKGCEFATVYSNRKLTASEVDNLQRLVKVQSKEFKCKKIIDKVIK